MKTSSSRRDESGDEKQESVKAVMNDVGTVNKAAANDKIENERSSRRRSFLKLLGGSVVGAAGVAAGIGHIERAEATQSNMLWNSAKILIGNSVAEQSPSPLIECPLFFENGRFANASHTLDLSDLQTTGKVKGTVVRENNTIEPDFSASLAAAVTQGSDGVQYLVVAGEGDVKGGSGYFRGVARAIIRCKYKVTEDNNANLLLIACVDCVIILVGRS